MSAGAGQRPAPGVAGGIASRVAELTGHAMVRREVSALSASKKKFKARVTELLEVGSSGRDEAIAELKRMGEDAIGPLLEALEDNDYKLRMVAARYLGDVAMEAAVPALVTALSDSSKNVQRCAADALTKIGQAAVEPLLDALIGKDQSARKWAAEALGDIGDRSVALELVKRLTDQNIEVQRAAVTALGELKNKRTIEPLVEVLDTDNVELAKAAAEALGKIRSSIAIEPLIRALSSPSVDVQRAAAESLKAVGPECVPPLLIELQSRDYIVRRWVVEILGEIGDDDARDGLINALSDENSRVVHYAAIALGKIGKPSAIRYLVELLDHPEKDVRCAVVEGLAHIGTYHAVEHLERMLGDEDWVTRLTAVKGLGNVGGRTCLTPLCQALLDEEWAVRKHAAEGLGKVGIRKGATEALIAAARDPKPSVRRSIACALGGLGGEEATAVLKKLASDPDDKVREAAEEALLSLEAEGVTQQA
ncbi:MAG TPA: hypothetical protein DGT21_19765 [Armatimonadetes bacterium]|nr:hypothetical protein [Armatimonadota bacterium]